MRPLNTDPSTTNPLTTDPSVTPATWSALQRQLSKRRFTAFQHFTPCRIAAPAPCIRQRGASALVMVLILLAMGTLMLHGLRQQLNVDLRGTASEVRAIRQFSAALSAQHWGMVYPWSLATLSVHWQCQQDDIRHWRACLRRDNSDNGVVLAAQNLPATAHDDEPPGSSFTVWRGGTLEAGKLHFSPHGWSDFCPLEETLCALP